MPEALEPNAAIFGRRIQHDGKDRSFAEREAGVVAGKVSDVVVLNYGSTVLSFPGAPLFPVFRKGGRTEQRSPEICNYAPSGTANASAISVFCSTSWAFPEPVAGLALAERFTERTGLPRATRSRRGSK